MNAADLARLTRRVERLERIVSELKFLENGRDDRTFSDRDFTAARKRLDEAFEQRTDGESVDIRVQQA